MNSILVLSFWNPTPKTPKKGIFIYNQIRAVCQHRTDIVFLQINILPSNSFFLKKNISTETINSNTFISLNLYSVFWKFIYVNPWIIFRFISKFLLQEFPSFQPKLIHSNIILPGGIVGHLLAKKYNAKHVISEHWSKAEEYIKNPIFGKLALNAYRNSNAILCVSKFLSLKLKNSIKSENVLVVPNIIDSNFNYAPKIDESYPCLRFFCIATWNLPKRLDLIVNSLNIFAKNTQKKLVLNVIGRGSQKDDLIKMPRSENFSINWLDYMEKEGIIEIFNKTDYFLQASEIETFSIVTVEALSTGTPVLASNVGALPEFIDESNGILVENTIECWVKGLEEMTGKTYDNKKIAREISGMFSSEKVGKILDNIYNSIIDK